MAFLKKRFIVVPPKLPWSPLTPAPYPYTVLPTQSKSEPIHVVPAEAGGPNWAKDVSNCTQKGPASNRLEQCWKGRSVLDPLGKWLRDAKSWYGVNKIFVKTCKNIKNIKNARKHKLSPFRQKNDYFWNSRNLASFRLARYLYIHIYRSAVLALFLRVQIWYW